VCKSYEGSKFWGRSSKIVSSTYVHIDLGDVHIVTMVVLGRVQFWVYRLPTLSMQSNSSPMFCNQLSCKIMNKKLKNSPKKEFCFFEIELWYA